MARITIVAAAILTALIPTCCHAFGETGQSAASVSINPASVTLVSKGSQKFKVVANGANSTQVKWMVAGVVGGNAQVGTISADGVYTAPAVASTTAVTLTAVAASNSRASASAVVAVEVDPAVEEAHQKWLAGIAGAAVQYGCSGDLIQQLPTESVADVVKLYVETAQKGTCLVLLPVSTDATSVSYSLASGGTIDGVPILYLSDVHRMRIWNGVEVSGE